MFALIGSGWRARMFLDVARGLGTVRCGGWWCGPRASWTCRPSRPWTPACASSPRFRAHRHAAAGDAGIIAEAVERGLPVLAETPPAPDLDGLRALWSAVGRPGWSRWPSST